MSQTQKQIIRLTVYSKDYSLDYENIGGFSTTQKNTIEILKNEGANRIFVYTDYHQEDNPNVYLKRISKIAKECGYTSTVTLKDMHQEMDGVRQEWKEISGQLVK